MAMVEVYEPPIGCAAGRCGPDAEEELAQFAAALESLEQRGFTVARYNLGLEPEAFASRPEIKAAIKRDGMSCLPMILSDGTLISERRYPSAGELIARLGGGE